MEAKDKFLTLQGQTNPSPYLIEVEKAEGLYIYDVNGKRYADMIAGVAVGVLGHRHPAVTKAIHDQVDKYLHVMVYGEFVQSPQYQLAEKLKTILPESLSTTYFVNSGTEANEAALKLAKRYTGRSEMISFNKSYHGSTHGSLSVSGNENKKYAFRPLLPGIKFIDFNVEDQLDQINDKTACVIVETIQGDAGVRIPDYNYMQALRSRCNETGALLILDEIQCGMGRTGKMFAFEHYNIVPDILTLAKGFGGGMNLGAFISSYEIMQTLTFEPMLGHITTFGGHPVGCAASLASLKALLEDDLLLQVEQKGKLIEKELNHPIVKEIRRKGLMFAIDLEDFEQVGKVVKYCLEHGVITFWFLSCNHSFRLSPPLNITEEEIREACKVIREGFDLVSG